MINKNRSKYQQSQGIPSIFSMLKPQSMSTSPVNPHQELKGKLAKEMQDLIIRNSVTKRKRRLLN